MDASLQLVERYEDLLQRTPDQSPYDYQSIFTADGFLARRAAQKKLELLKRLDPQLRPVLWAGERVVFLTTGVLHSFAEAYFLGAAMYYLNRRALVLTTERLLLVRIDSRSKPRELKSQLLLSNVATASASMLGNTKLRTQSGRSYMFTAIPRRDRKPLVEHLQRLSPAATRRTAHQELAQLCPHCFEHVPGRPASCEKCGGGIKSPTRAALLSLLFPGLGTMYLGHWGLGVLKALVGTILWLGVIVPDPAQPVTAEERIIMAVMIIVIFHGISALTSWLLARRGHYPGTPPTRSMPAQG